jgi:hypothetical protein
MRYTKTVIIHSKQGFDSLHIGQWFQLGKHGMKGQYLGKTRAGVDACRYGKFSTMNAVRNMLVRSWAKQNGAR